MKKYGGPFIVVKINGKYPVQLNKSASEESSIGALCELEKEWRKKYPSSASTWQNTRSKFIIVLEI